MSRIFISYKRVDKDKVFKIKDQIESALGEKCWIDLDGIESDAQFVKVIINAIDEAEVFLFMHSAAHSLIQDFENDWTIRELNYAKEEKKTIVFINIDDAPLSKWFKFMFPQKQQVDATSNENITKLCDDLERRLFPERAAERERKREEAEKEALRKLKEEEDERIRKEAEEKARKAAEQRVREEELARLRRLEEEERVRTEAEEKARVEAAEMARKIKEAEARARAETEQNACEEEYENAHWSARISSLKNPWYWAALGVVIIGGIIIGYYSNEDSSSNEDSIQNLTVNEDSIQHYTVNGVSFEMIKVEAGTFTMGDQLNKEHAVTLDCYFIGETEVTQALWKAVMGNNPSFFPGDNHPVEKVSWDDCQEFIKKLNKETGREFRLPTEAEWEFAAQGGNKSLHTKYSGSNELDEVSWNKSNSRSMTHPVKAKKPNELGIYDMTGNVWEWCQDWYGSYNSSPQINPTGPLSGSDRVGRGGSWFNDAMVCRLSYRYNSAPDYTYFGLGFRLALSE